MAGWTAGAKPLPEAPLTYACAGCLLHSYIPLHRAHHSHDPGGHAGRR